jgi:hypothetical protein
MNSKFLLILIGSVLAIPQNYNEVFANGNNVASVESKFARRTFAQYNESFEERDNVQESSGLDVGIQYMLNEFGLEEGVDYKITSSHSSDIGVTYIYMTRLIDGLEVSNSHMNLNVRNNGEVSVGGYFNDINSRNRGNSDEGNSNTEEEWGSPVDAIYALFDYLEVDPEMDLAKANPVDDSGVSFVVSNVNAAGGDVTVTKKYAQAENGENQKVWAFEVDLGDHYWSAAVSPSGEVIELNDLVNSYY